jgi:hypothetical protein
MGLYLTGLITVSVALGTINGPAEGFIVLGIGTMIAGVVGYLDGQFSGR